jgi:hypothetical protein
MRKHFKSSAEFVRWIDAMGETDEFAREYQSVHYHYEDGSTESKKRKATTSSRTVGHALQSAATGGGANRRRREKIDSVGGVTIEIEAL